MAQHLQPNKQCISLLPQIPVGQEQQIVPYHVVKYKLRSGTGQAVSPGMTLQCLVDIFLIDGTQIVSSNGNKVTKYLFGRNRLIAGLELGLAKVRRHQKIRLIISSEYAYKDQTDIPLIPANSKLIFQIDVINFIRPCLENMTDVQLYYQVYHYLDESDRLFRAHDQSGGLYNLTVAYNCAKRIKHYKSSIVGKILVKWGNVLYHRKDYQNALLVVNRVYRFDDSLEDCFRLKIKLYRALNMNMDLDILVENMYNQHLYDYEIKRICVNYYKEIQNWDKLKKLPGYDFKKDRFSQIKFTQKSSAFHMMQ